MSGRHLAIVASLALLGQAGACGRRPTQAPAISHGPHAALAWSTWGSAAFERAERDDKLVLINVIASWCHWCHVMEETTYADPEVASLLADHFVIIRVDSDARPDLSERYRRWGWPATAILSPRAQPAVHLRGYRKPEVFAALLRELVAEHARGELRRAEPEPISASLAADADLEPIRARAARQLDAAFDEEGLGWGDRQKYPWPGPIEYALLRARVRGEARWRERALATLAAERELIDPVWGGMYQYSLRGVWDRPHYEKIAMIQAGAIETFAHAAMITKDREWLVAADQVASYVLDTLQDPAGGFYASQDADLREPVTVEGHDYYALDDPGRRRLGLPRVDRAVYADLNGQIIYALTELHRASGDPASLEAATRAADRLLETHRRGGGFSHGPSDAPDALLHLADQAAMGRALLGLARVGGRPRELAAAVELATFMIDELEAPAGGFFAHSEDPEAVGVFAERRKPLPENALAAQFLIELQRVDPGGDWLGHARRALLAVGSDAQIKRRGKVVGRYLYALDLLASPTVDLTVVAGPNDPRGDELWRAVLQIWEPRAHLERSRPGQRYPDTGSAALYLCTERTCARPIRDPERVAELAERFLLDALPRLGSR